MTPSRLLPLLAAASLAACAGGPPPEIATPTPELPQEFLFATGADEQATLAALLPSDDPAFIALSQQALANSPTLGEALARVEQARAGAARAGAERLPNVSADAAVSRSRTNIGTFPENAPFELDLTQTNYAANINARWDPDIFGALRASERAAVLRVDAAEAGASAVRLALISEIAATVIDWRTLANRMDELRSDRDAAVELSRLAAVREDAGIAPGFDRVRAESAAAASRSRLAALASERNRLAGRMVTLTAQPLSEVLSALTSEAGTPTMPPAPATLPSQLLNNRPDVVQAAANLAAADADLAATARRRFPQFTLSAAIGLLAFDPSDVFDEDSIVGALATSVVGPLLDFGRLEAEIDGAAAAKKAAFEAYRGAVFTALGDAETAYGLVTSSDAEARAAVEERDSAQRAARLANDRYEAGLADFLTVLEARRSADASGERAAAAIGRARRARVVLWQAVGGDSAVGEDQETSRSISQ
ncbi:efflux transporter outer membrane subunit [Qipengyuania sp. DGS5-3]|uniref:efflux transporter outer membrane subunit n=1 Tax=Qipengyuania sp. DGS5-3 TaxID=3349632 RepID=UPI0036D252DE